MNRTAHLVKDRQEKFNTKRGWFVTAWRIVDAQGQDLVQPWMNSKTEAKEVAELLGITLMETT